MTPLQLALTSKQEMDAYLDQYATSEIIEDIKAYSNVDRTLIATAAMKGILSNSPDWSDSDHNLDWVSNAAVKFSDRLIASLNKQP